MKNEETMVTYSIKHVLMPFDFSPASLPALQAALTICKRQSSRLTLLHVVENSYLLYDDIGRNDLTELMRSADHHIGNLVEEVQASGIRAGHLVGSGNPADEICRLASEEEASLIVIGTQGSSEQWYAYLGSTAYRVVKNATCPVLTIPQNSHSIDFKKILFPVRKVPHALDKYHVARPIIEKNDASLLIAGIVKRNEKSTTGVQVLLDNFQRLIADDNVRSDSYIHSADNDARGVLEVADVERPDLIIITASVDTTLDNFYLGDYTQDILGGSTIPVLSVKSA